MGFVRKPSTTDKVHCVVFVIDGSKVGSYAKSFGATFQLLREHISNLGEFEERIICATIASKESILTMKMG